MQNTPDAFSSLLSDPGALSSIAELLSKLPQASAPSPPPPPPPQEHREESSASPPDMSGLLGSLLSRPEVLSALPSVMKMLSGSGAQSASAQSASAQTASAQTTGQMLLGQAAPHREVDRRCALLSALRPYLPEDKRTAVDTVIRVIEIMSLIK